MHVGVPKEVKVAERRVGLTPASVRELVAHGHEVTDEAGQSLALDKSLKERDFDRSKGSSMGPPWGAKM